MQEFSLAVNKAADNATKLNKIFNKILDYFIQLTKQLKSEAEPTSEYLVEFQASHLFYVCLILMRRVCHSSGGEEKATAGSAFGKEDDLEQFSYFQALFQTCMKVHKKILKEVKVERMDVDGGDQSRAAKIKINSFHIDFIRVSFERYGG